MCAFGGWVLPTTLVFWLKSTQGGFMKERTWSTHSSPLCAEGQQR